MTWRKLPQTKLLLLAFAFFAAALIIGTIFPQISPVAGLECGPDAQLQCARFAFSQILIAALLALSLAAIVIALWRAFETRANGAIRSRQNHSSGGKNQ